MISYTNEYVKRSQNKGHFEGTQNLNWYFDYVFQLIKD